MQQAVQRVIDILNCLVLAIRFTSQIAHCIVAVAFSECRRERGLRDPAARVVSKIRGVVVRVGDRGQVVSVS